MEAGISEHATSVTSVRDRAYRIRIVAYWFFTLLVAYEMVAGALWALLQVPPCEFDAPGLPALPPDNPRGLGRSRSRGASRPAIWATQRMGVRRRFLQLLGRGCVPCFCG